MLKLSPMYREFLLELARQAANHKCKNKTKDNRFNAFFFGKELVTKKIHEKKIRESQRMFSSIQIRRFFKKARTENLIVSGKKTRGSGRHVSLVLGDTWRQILTQNNKHFLRQCLFEERKFLDLYEWTGGHDTHIPFAIFNYVLGVLEERGIALPREVSLEQLHRFFDSRWKYWKKTMLQRAFLKTQPLTFSFEMCFANFAIAKLQKTKDSTIRNMIPKKIVEHSFGSGCHISNMENSMPKGWMVFVKKFFPNKKEGEILDTFFKFKAKYLVSEDGKYQTAKDWREVFFAYLCVGDETLSMRELILKSEEIRVKRMFNKRPDTPYAAAKKAREILASFAKDPREREWIKRIDFAKVAKYLGFEVFSKKHNKGKQKVQDILKTEMYKKFNGDFVEDRKRKEKKVTIPDSHIGEISPFFGKKELHLELEDWTMRFLTGRRMYDMAEAVEESQKIA